MTDIVTAVYDSDDAVTNAFDDLVATGIPDEEIRINPKKHQIQVMTPHVSEPEVEEILKRHQPVKLDS